MSQRPGVDVVLEAFPEKLWSLVGCDPAALERVTLTGVDPILPTDFKIGTAASAVIAAGALAASEIWRPRTGRSQAVSVGLRAAVAAFRSERCLLSSRTGIRSGSCRS